MSGVKCGQTGRRALITALKVLFVIQVKCVGWGPLRSVVEQIAQVVFSVLSKHLQPPPTVWTSTFNLPTHVLWSTRSSETSPNSTAEALHASDEATLVSPDRLQITTELRHQHRSEGAELVGFKSDIFCPEAGSGHEPSVFIQSSAVILSDPVRLSVVQDKFQSLTQMCSNRTLFALDSNDTAHNKSALFVPMDYRPDCSEWALEKPPHPQVNEYLSLDLIEIFPLVFGLFGPVHPRSSIWCHMTQT